VKRPRKPAGPAQEGPKVPTTINMPLDLATLLQDAAIARARKTRAANLAAPRGTRESPRPSSRSSVSQLVVELLEQHRADLERIARGDD
jgi:hypothetical protein